jgi:hypothetical protein
LNHTLNIVYKGEKLKLDNIFLKILDGISLITRQDKQDLLIFSAILSKTALGIEN